MKDVHFQKLNRPERYTLAGVASLVTILCLLVLLPALGQALNIDWIIQINNTQSVALFVAISLVAILCCAVVMLLSRLQSLQTARGIDSHAALHDALTGAANRRQFSIRLDQLLEDSEPSHTLLMIDLDRFKPINDLYGHAAGDALLRELTLGMKRLVRHDDLVARLGGDEFAMLLANRPPKVAEQAALDVLQFVTKYRLAWEGHRLSVGASIGLVNINQPGMTPTLVLAASDEALYAAKEAGRGAVFVVEINRAPDEKHCFRRINSETFEPQPSANSHVPEDGRKQELLARVMANLVSNNEGDRRRTSGSRNRYQIRHWISVEPTTVGDQLNPGSLMRELIADAAARSDGGADFARWVMAMSLDGASRMNSSSLGHIGFVLPVPARAFVVVPTLADELMRSNALARLPIRHITFILHGISAVYRAPEIKRMQQRFLASDVRLGYEIRSDNLEALAPMRYIPFDELHLGQELIKKLRPDADSNPVLDALMAVADKTCTSLVAARVETQEELQLLNHTGITRVNGAATGSSEPLHELLSRLAEPSRRHS